MQDKNSYQEVLQKNLWKEEKPQTKTRQADRLQATRNYRWYQAKLQGQMESKEM